MNTPAATGPNIAASIDAPEKTEAETKEALLGLRIEMRAMHQHLAVELDEMRKMRVAQQRAIGWMVGLYLAGTATLLAAMAHNLGWLW